MSVEAIGERIKQIRETRGISASKFARLVGVTPTCVWNWERGATNPRPAALAAICNAFDVEEPFLLVGNRTANHDDDSSPTNVDDILSEASSRIAAMLGVTKDRVKLRFEVVPIE